MTNNTLLLLIALPLLASALLTTTDKQYMDFSTASNPHSFTHFFFSQDMTIAMLYGRSSPNGTAFQAYNWHPHTNASLSIFTTPPNYVTYFWSSSNQQHNYLYGDVDGNILRKFVGSAIIKYWTIEDEQKDVEKTVLSPDQQIAAVYCRDSEKVYLIDFKIIGRPRKQLNFTGVVNAIRWRDGSNQLAIAGGDPSTETYFTLYDYKQQTEEDLSFLTDALVLDLSFSPDGNTIFFIEFTPTQSSPVVQVYDFTSQQSRTLTAPDVQQFVGVSVRGSFVSAWDGQYVYVWNRLTSDFYGKYESKLETNGLSPDGSNLVTLVEDPASHLKILSLCQKGALYDPVDQTCLPCQSPCYQCFLTQNKCSSCLPSSFLTPSFTCQLCSTRLIGCSQCSNSSVCTECNSAEHWTLNGTSCKCALRYVNINDVCLPCPSHCLQCSDTATCQVCDIFEHYYLKDNTCVCLDGYFQTNDTCQPCYEGCLSCHSSATCDTCYTSRHWQMRDGKCQCMQEYAYQSGMCLPCGYLIDFCVECSSDKVCDRCQEGYEFDEGSHKCVEEKSSNTIIFVLVGVAAVVLVVVGFFMWRYLKKKREGRSLLETEAQDSIE